MRQTLADLCTLLQEQKEILSKMLALAKEERQIIISGESEKLEEVIRLEFWELNRLGVIENQRLELHKVIARELRIPVDEDITVTIIAENAEPDERDVIRKLQMELMPLIEEHAAVNMENRELTKAHIEH
ncbi:MAG: flagellar protein FlgN [Oscillospiraceae bacterium]|nr:flagellar protein FlgN [Oscillospiraceae bacterium]